MPRPKTEPKYAKQVATLAEEGCRPADIARIIEKSADTGDWPSESTVRRLYREHMQRDPSERRQEAWFSWPESMESKLLPWEAARAALDLVHYCDENGFDRPTVRHCKWFWYLRLAAPAVPIDFAATASGYLWAREYLRETKANEDIDVPGVMWTLAYQPWRSKEDRSAHEAVAKRLCFDPNAVGLSSSKWGDAEDKALALGSLNPGIAAMYECLSKPSSPKTDRGGEDNV